jgi:hypothetical protein
MRTNVSLAIYQLRRAPRRILLFLTDSVDEAARYIQTQAIEHFGLRRRPLPQRSRFLWE